MEENLSEKEDGQAQARVLKGKKPLPKSLQGSNVDVHQLLKANKKLKRNQSKNEIKPQIMREIKRRESHIIPRANPTIHAVAAKVTKNLRKKSTWRLQFSQGHILGKTSPILWNQKNPFPNQDSMRLRKASQKDIINKQAQRIEMALQRIPKATLFHLPRIPARWEKPHDFLFLLI